MAFMDALSSFFGLPPRKDGRHKKVDLKLDPEIFRGLCQIMYKGAPKDSPFLAMEASVPPESDAPSTLEVSCYVKKSNGKNVRFELSDEAKKTALELLIKLRQAMVDQKHPPLKGLKLTVDVPLNKYNADFRY